MDSQQLKDAALELIVALMEQNDQASFQKIGVNDKQVFMQLLKYEVDRKPDRQLKQFLFTVAKIVKKYDIPTEEKKIVNLFDRIKG